MIEGTQPATSLPLFSAFSSPQNRGSQGGPLLRCGLSAGAGIGGEIWLADLHNERASWGPGALSEGTFRGPTLIKVKSLKSDFDRRDPAGNFPAAFLRLQQSAKKGKRWRTPSRGRAIRRCRNRGIPCMISRHNEPSSLARRASGGGIYAGSEELNFND